MREFDQGKIAGTDVNMDGYIEFEPLPTNGPSEWLPKTDWSKDRIIANEDSQ